MQELIDNLESIDINIPKGVKLIFLEKEKEHIKTAFESGWNWNFSSEKYYNETYIQKEEQKQHIVDIMKADEDDGLYNETNK